MSSAKAFKKNENSFSKTRKNRKNSSKSELTIASFQKQITIVFFEMLLLIKLFHWKTYRFSTHKATDKLYEKLNENMDRFMEVLFGKSGIRMDFKNQKTIPLIDVGTQEILIKKINLFINYLVKLNSNKTIILLEDTGLLNIRDEILEDLNQFLYLLSLK